MHTHLFENELKQTLSNYFGELEAENYLKLKSLLQWHTFASGEVLFHQNDTADSMYILLSGRLVAKIKNAEQKFSTIGEIARGECVGEMAILTDKPRSASVFALRDSVLIELKKDAFVQYTDQNPTPYLAFSKVIAKRLEKQNSKAKHHKQLNIALVPLTKNCNLEQVIASMQSYLEEKQRCICLDSQSVNAQFHFDINGSDISLEQNALLSDYMYSLEKDSHIVFYETDDALTNWTKKCVSQADAIVFVGNFYENEAVLMPNLEFVQTLRNRVEDLPVFLTLLHQDATQLPENTKKRWLNLVKPKQHFHVRWSEAKDFRRLARSITGYAIGLACGGGGAKGFAEIGIYKAMMEENMEIDYVTGVSFGALSGAAIALDWTPERIEKEASEIFMGKNVLRDYRIPFISMSGGKHAEEETQKVFPGNIEDMWLPFVCNSCNISNFSLHLHKEGEIFSAIRASFAIPGVLPPKVIDSNYLIDGGLMNNLPVDVLYLLGCAQTIGIDVSSVNESYAETSNQAAPSTWTVLKAKIRRKKINFPSFLENIERSMMLASYQHTMEMHQKADLMFSPPVKAFGLVEWSALPKLVEIGYAYAKNALGALSEEEKRIFR